MKRDPFKICKLCFGLWKQKYLFMSILKNGLNVDRYVVEVLTKTHRSKYKQPQRHFLCNFNLIKNVSNSLYWHHNHLLKNVWGFHLPHKLALYLATLKFNFFSSEFCLCVSHFEKTKWWQCPETWLNWQKSRADILCGWSACSLECTYVRRRSKSLK